MDNEELSAEFRRVCQVAAGIDGESDSVSEFEPQLLRLVDLARQMSTDAAVRCFIELVRGDVEAPFLTVPFCMHTLRYPEVRDEVARIVGEPPDPRWMNYASDVIHAYENDWEHRDLWCLASERSAGG